MDYSLPYLGKITRVKIDRPMNTKHPKYNNIYPVNYGYIPDTKAPDGSELDAYVLGVNKPILEFKGRCIAIIHRFDDNDDKLIVCPDGQEYSDEQIRELTNFQERWFKSEIVRPKV
jgi:inorganic pyrophosphatase